MYEAQVQLLEPQMESEAHVRHILAPTKEAIDRIAAELKTGVDFAVLAARRSTDEASRLDGGDLGFMTVDEASPEFARVIRDVPEGGVSRPFEDAKGWHIVKIEQVRKRRPPSIDVLRETIERYLKSQQLEKILKDLRADAEIVKRNPSRSSSLDAPAATAPARARAGSCAQACCAEACDIRLAGDHHPADRARACSRSGAAGCNACTIASRARAGYTCAHNRGACASDAAIELPPEGSRLGHRIRPARLAPGARAFSGPAESGGDGGGHAFAGPLQGQGEG